MNGKKVESRTVLNKKYVPPYSKIQDLYFTLKRIVRFFILKVTVKNVYVNLDSLYNP